MGQAKNRKAEIMALKTANPQFKDNVLTMFGAHYKSDQDYGFSITLTNKNFGGPTGLGGTITGFLNMMNNMVTGYDKHVGVEVAWPDRDTTATDLLNQLDSLVIAINNKLYGTDTQPEAGVTKLNNIAPALQEILCFIANVMWLTKYGYLTNDNFNGTQYCYESK